VDDSNPTFVKYPRNQQAAMTASWILLAAHNNYRLVLNLRLDSREPAFKLLGLGYASVENVTVIVVVLISTRPSTEFFAHIYVRDRARSEGIGEAVLVELLSVFGFGVRSRVGDECDTVQLEQIDEALERLIRMTNCKDLAQ
jgi:GNAT superfamily N-acetyltransferase